MFSLSRLVCQFEVSLNFRQHIILYHPVFQLLHLQVPSGFVLKVPEMTSGRLVLVMSPVSQRWNNWVKDLCLSFSALVSRFN